MSQPKTVLEAYYDVLAALVRVNPRRSRANMLATIAALEALLLEGATIPTPTAVVEMLAEFTPKRVLAEAFGHPFPERVSVPVVADDA